MKHIEIIISPNGATTIQTHGFSGTACQQASRFLEVALGRRSGERFTSAFYETQQQNITEERHHT